MLPGCAISFNWLKPRAGKRFFSGRQCPSRRCLPPPGGRNADLVGVSYRLTPETGERLLGEFAEAADELHAAGMRFVFGGTPPVAKRVQALGFFEQVFDGSQPPEEVLAYLRGQPVTGDQETDIPQTTVDRIRWKSPYPLLRHHFGLPDMEATLHGIEADRRCQGAGCDLAGHRPGCPGEFLSPGAAGPAQMGSGRGAGAQRGGLPKRCTKPAARGNYPLMRTYSGTDDFIRLAEMYVETIHNAWCAIPLFWFNQMDGRGPWDLEGSIREHQQVMAWYGERGIPVELNEPHHWGMRDAPDEIYVVSAFLAAYNARHYGVKDYIAQMMFNSPPGSFRQRWTWQRCWPSWNCLPPWNGRISAFGARRAPACSVIPWTRKRHAGTWLPASTCRWRSSRISFTWSGTRRRIMPPARET